MRKKKILITFVESGFGHIASAKSISDSLKAKYKDEFEIEDCNIMKESAKSVSFEKFLTKQTQATNKIHGYGFFVFGLLELLGGARFLRLTHKTIFKKYVNSTIEVIKKHNPDIIISTHYYITYCAIEYKLRHNANCVVITYNPDNNVHPWWDNREGIFITNNIYATSEAVYRRKFKGENCYTVNFTARKDIVECDATKNDLRERYDIDKNAFCVIVADGGYALGKCKKVVDELLKTSKNLTIIAIAGKNQKIYNSFKNKQINANIEFLPLKFVTNIHELYCVSDIFITKAGPNSVLDSVFMNTPIIIDYYPHPIEKATKKLFVDKYGCGEYIRSPKKIRKRVEEFIDDKQTLHKYINNTRKFKRECNGADEIADIVYNVAREDKQ